MGLNLKNKFIENFGPNDDPVKQKKRIALFRFLAVITSAAALNYIIWRYVKSLNMNALWFAVPMVIAETYGIIESFLFIYMVWKPIKRQPPEPPEKADVDVFIVTFNEPVELVRKTVEAASGITWEGKKVYLLDDGSRLEMKALAEEFHCGYITRGIEWAHKPRHAKAGNINNAMLQTSGEYILVLDADQIPESSIIKKIIGYFEDPEVAFIQTPQHFYNIPPGDPFGNDAPLFYGPIQEGKDGHNAAYFCGSNGMLRREALVQLGITSFVEEMEEQVRHGIKALKKQAKTIQTPDRVITRQARDILSDGLKTAERLMKQNEPLEIVSDEIRKTIHQIEHLVAIDSFDEIADMLKNLAVDGDMNAAEAYNHIIQDEDSIAEQTDSAKTGTSIGIDSEVFENINLTRSDEAIPVQSMSTISITEDMATSMRLHAAGWKSVYHSEILAYGLAPEDLSSALKQRLRWAQGTVQVFLRSNPFKLKGLTLSQRLMYFATINSYFNGFFNLLLIISPIFYLFTAIAPVSVWSWGFLFRLLPFFILNKVTFRYLSWGISVWRGEQYDLALFPLFIKATLTALFKKEIPFVVTSKDRKKRDKSKLKLIWPQLSIIILTTAAIIYGFISYFILGSGLTFFGLFINTFWGIYNAIMLLVVIRAAFYKLPEGWSPRPPETVFHYG